MDSTTILQKRKSTVKITKEEILVILRSYQLHPSKWPDIIEDVKGNTNLLPENAKRLYMEGSNKQLRDRMSTKLSKLLAVSEDEIKDVKIRQEIQNIKKMERRLVESTSAGSSRVDGAKPDPRNSAALQLSSSSDEESVTDTAEKLLSATPSASVSTETATLTKTLLVTQKNKRKRSIGDLVRENQMAYNNFITKKIPKLLRELGVSDSD